MRGWATWGRLRSNLSKHYNRGLPTIMYYVPALSTVYIFTVKRQIASFDRLSTATVFQSIFYLIRHILNGKRKSGPRKMVPGKMPPEKSPSKIVLRPKNARKFERLFHFYRLIPLHTQKDVWRLRHDPTYAPNCETLEESRKDCCQVLGFHRLITSEHSTHTPRCSTLTPWFLVSEFPGDHFSEDQFSGDHFSGDQFFGDHFSGDRFSRRPFFRDLFSIASIKY